MTLCVIAAVRLNRRASDARHLPKDRLLAPECTLTCARAYRVVHPKPLNWHEWSRFRSMLDRATVFGGREESSGKSRLIYPETGSTNFDLSTGTAAYDPKPYTLLAAGETALKVL